MPKYHINYVKPVSNARRYEWIREHGMMIETTGSHPRLVKGQELDDHFDKLIWMRAHPGKPTEKSWD